MCQQSGLMRVTRKQILRSLSLSYPKKNWRAGVQPILLWVWRYCNKFKLYTGVIQFMIYSEYNAGHHHCKLVTSRTQRETPSGSHDSYYRMKRNVIYDCSRVVFLVSVIPKTTQRRIGDTPAKTLRSVFLWRVSVVPDPSTDQTYLPFWRLSLPYLETGQWWIQQTWFL